MDQSSFLSPFRFEFLEMSLRDAREESLWLEILVVYRCKVVLRNTGQTVLTQEV